MSTQSIAKRPRSIETSSVRSRVLAIDLRAVRAVLAAYLTSRLLLFLIIFVSSAAMPMQPRNNLYASPSNLLLDGLIRFDSWWYVDIVRNGYSLGNTATGEQGTVAFFPLYPLVVRAVATVAGNDFLAGVLVSNIALLVALAYLYRLIRREFDDETAARAVFYLAGAPTAVFFSAMYTESLYLALVIAGFFYARESHWARAALAGGLAAATRNTGAVMALVLLLEGMHQSGARFRPPAWHPVAIGRHLGSQIGLGIKKWQPLVAALAATLGLFAYMVYLANRFGDPFAFITVQSTWGRTTSPGGILQLVENTRNDLNVGPHFWMGQFNPPTLMDLIATLAFAPLVVAVVWKLRPAYAVYALATFLVPLFTGSIGSMTRYTLTLVPCYILLAVWGGRSTVDRIVVGTFLPLFAFFAILFSHWYFAG
jgi:hypothetical protein